MLHILHHFSDSLMTIDLFHTGKMEYTKLKYVNETSQQWTVRARVVRFCRYLSPDDPTKIRRLDLVLLDEEVLLHLHTLLIP